VIKLARARIKWRSQVDRFEVKIVGEGLEVLDFGEVRGLKR